jgi:hypothetical protein
MKYMPMTVLLLSAAVACPQVATADSTGLFISTMEILHETDQAKATEMTVLPKAGHDVASKPIAASTTASGAHAVQSAGVVLPVATVVVTAMLAMAI